MGPGWGETQRARSSLRALCVSIFNLKSSNPSISFTLPESDSRSPHRKSERAQQCRAGSDRPPSHGQPSCPRSDGRRSNCRPEQNARCWRSCAPSPDARAAHPASRPDIARAEASALEECRESQPCSFPVSGQGQGQARGPEPAWTWWCEIELHAMAASSTRAGASTRVERMDPPGKGRGLPLGGRKHAPALSYYPTLIYRIIPQSRRLCEVSCALWLGRLRDRLIRTHRRVNYLAVRSFNAVYSLAADG